MYVDIYVYCTYNHMYVCMYLHWCLVCVIVFLNLNCLVTDEEDPEKGGNEQKKDKQKKITK